MVTPGSQTLTDHLRDQRFVQSVLLRLTALGYWSGHVLGLPALGGSSSSTSPAIAFVNAGDIDTNGNAGLAGFTSFDNAGTLDLAAGTFTAPAGVPFTNSGTITLNRGGRSMFARRRSRFSRSAAAITEASTVPKRSVR